MTQGRRLMAHQCEQRRQKQQSNDPGNAVENDVCSGDTLGVGGGTNDGDGGGGSCADIGANHHGGGCIQGQHTARGGG